MAKKTAVLKTERASFRIEGLEELIQILRKMGDAAGDVLAEAVLVGAEVIAREARVNAPGEGIEVELISKSEKRAEAAIGPDKAHWHYVFAETGARPHEILPHLEDGTLKLVQLGEVFASRLAGEHQHPGFPARPFLRPAVDSKEDEAVGALAAVLWHAIDRYAEKPG